MRFIRCLAVVLLGGIILGPAPGQARFVDHWAYERLLAEADLVAVIEPVKTENNNDKRDGIGAGTLQGLTTSFKIRAILKGAPMGEDLILRHFEYKEGTMGDNGALHIHFLIGPLRYKKTELQNGKEVSSVTYYQVTPCWLAFLKKRPDGSFVPVTGLDDDIFSFKELHDSSFF